MCSSDPDVDAAADPHALPDGELLDEITAAITERNRLDARITHLVRVADARQASEHDGLKAMQSWLRGHTRMKRSTAAALVHRGRDLDLLPATAAAFTAGEIGVDHLTEIAEPKALARAQHPDIDIDIDIDIAQVDQALATVAAHAPFQKLAATVREYLAKLDPDGSDPARADQHGGTPKRDRRSRGTAEC